MAAKTKMQATVAPRQKQKLNTLYWVGGIALLSIFITASVFIFYFGVPGQSVAKIGEYHTIATGLWNSEATWKDNVYPGYDPAPSNMTININAPHEVTLPASLKLSQNTVMNVYGTAVVREDFYLMHGSNINVKTNGILIVMGDYDADHHMVLENNGKIVFLGDVKTAHQSSVNNNGDMYSDRPVNSTSGNSIMSVSDAESDQELRDILEFNGYSFTTLPVELVEFKARATNAAHQVTLHWSTASEINNDYFTVERSEDGHQFKTIGTVKGFGNSKTVRNYQFVDNQPLYGTAYYQLKQTDFDGQYEYFKPIAVELSIGEDKMLDIKNIGPNPFSNVVNVQYTTVRSATVEINIVNSSGQSVYSNSLMAHAGYNEFQYTEGSRLSPDVYLLTISQHGVPSKTVRLVKR